VTPDDERSDAGTGASTDPDEEEELESEIERTDRDPTSGLTADELRRGPSLDEQLAEETRNDDGDDGASIALGEEDAPDDEAQLIGSAEAQDDPWAAPEDRALSVTDEPPGLTDDPDDGSA
jgi:hypothetical protein